MKPPKKRLLINKSVKKLVKKSVNKSSWAEEEIGRLCLKRDHLTDDDHCICDGVKSLLLRAKAKGFRRGVKEAAGIARMEALQEGAAGLRAYANQRSHVADCRHAGEEAAFRVRDNILFLLKSKRGN